LLQKAWWRTMQKKAVRFLVRVVSGPAKLDPAGVDFTGRPGRTRTC